MLASITPVILTLDEEPNIDRTLAALSWAGDIVIVDSGSTDRTLEIARAHPQVRTFNRPFDRHASQWNFAVSETGIASEWILALDADYQVSDALAEELRHLEPPSGIAGYRTSFEYCVFGKRLRGSVYPPVITLYRRGRGRYEQDGHTQRLVLDGACGRLIERIRHDDRKPLSRWLRSQIRYSELEANKLASTPVDGLSAADKVRRAVVLAPPLVFLYALFAKGAILDGAAGLYYALQRATSEMLLSLHLVHAYLAQKKDTRGQ